MLGDGVKLGVEVGPRRDVGLRLHALSRANAHNPSRSFLKSISMLITGNDADVNLKINQKLVSLRVAFQKPTNLSLI